MKRLVPILLAAFLAVPAFAIVTDRGPVPQAGDRIGILMMPERYAEGSNSLIADHVRRYLREELRGAGFDAYDAGRTYDDLDRRDPQNADYYIEIVGADGDSREHDLGGIQTDHGGVEIGLSVARVAAAIRIYDGRSLELLHTYDLHGKSRIVVPTDVNVGVRGLIAWIAVPFIEHAQFRIAAHDVARDAVHAIRKPE
jgi:hypothetical protein